MAAAGSFVVDVDGFGAELDWKLASLPATPASVFDAPVLQLRARQHAALRGAAAAETEATIVLSAVMPHAFGDEEPRLQQLAQHGWHPKVQGAQNQCGGVSAPQAQEKPVAWTVVVPQHKMKFVR